MLKKIKDNWSYIKWFFRYRIAPAFTWYTIANAPKAFVRFCKNLWSFWTNNGVRADAWWDITSMVSEKFLRASKGFIAKSNGYPGKEGDPASNTPEAWAQTVHEMRFAHFWLLFGRDMMMFSWEWTSPTLEARKNTYLWAKRKYWWASEFITPRFIAHMVPLARLQWNTVLNFSDTDSAGLHSLDFTYVNKTTGEIVVDQPEGFDDKAYAATCEARHVKGMALFASHYQSLWD